MSEKVKVSKAMGEFIKQLTDDYNNTDIVELYTAKSLVNQSYELSLDSMIRAIYIGYEVEETPEEKVWSFYHTKAACDMHPHHAIQHVLNILNIKIEGVNT